MRDEHDAWLAGVPAAYLGALVPVHYWIEGDDLRGPGRSALVPGGMAMLDAADWLNDQGLGQAIIIEELPRAIEGGP